MHNTNPVVQRYRRTDQDRLGQWAPVDASWKTAASAGLVSHDMYHHLPTDSGLFVQEVAALGAEWYVDRQSLTGFFQETTPRNLVAFERNFLDTVLNALDSRERRPFVLPVVTITPLSPDEMEYFRHLATKAYDMLLASDDARARDCEDFVTRLVLNLVQGVATSRKRFPDQHAVRKGSHQLTDDLSYLDTSDVPYGHDITLTLEGYDCRIEFTDADAPFLAENQVQEAVMMRWFLDEEGYPLKHASVHPSTGEYFEYAQDHFESQDAGAAEGDTLIPEGESDTLRRVYVANPSLREELVRTGSFVLPLDSLRKLDQTPRGVWII